jgi:hypothetical protein
MAVPDPELSLELGCYALMLHALMLRAAVIRKRKPSVSLSITHI